MHPAAPRDVAKLLVVEAERRSDRMIADLPRLLRRGDMLVLNDTRVIPATADRAARRGARRDHPCTVG